MKQRLVVWSEEALGELESAVAYIAARNPTAATRVLAELEQAAVALGMFTVGRPGRVVGTYEKPISDRPYIIVYALHPLPSGEERVVILRVIHTARNWPEGEWPS